MKSLDGSGNKRGSGRQIHSGSLKTFEESFTANLKAIKISKMVEDKSAEDAISKKNAEYADKAVIPREH